MDKLPKVNIRKTGLNIFLMSHDVGLSAKDIAEALCLTSPQAVYKWYNGKCLPSIDNLVALASVFGVTIDDIIVTE